MKSRRNDIIEKSMKLFNKEGYQSPSIDRISENAGISKMTFYRYFPDKESLITEILKEKHHQFISAIKSITEKYPTAKEKLFSIFQYYEKWFCCDEFHGCMFTRAVFEYGSSSPSLIEISSIFKSHLCSLIRDVLLMILKPEPAERVAFMILLLIDGAIAASQTETPESQEFPPAITAWSAAKAIIYSEGGSF